MSNPGFQISDCAALEFVLATRRSAATFCAPELKDDFYGTHL
jgi:hypothetical protein